MSTSTELDALDRGLELGSGGQGKVYAIKRSPNVVKLFAAGTRIKADVLQSLPDAFASLPSAVNDRVVAPLQVVTDQGRTVGFTMQAIGSDFSFTSPDGKKRLYEIQHLLNGHEYAHKIFPGLNGYTQAASYRLLADLAGTLCALHERGIVVGDISPRNLLFSLSGEPRMLIIDADSMVVNGRSVYADHAETPGWKAPEFESLPAANGQPTAASDRYKFGLLALRLIAGDQSAKTPAAIPQRTPPMLRSLITEALSDSPGNRPSLTTWKETLTFSAMRATFWVADPKPHTQPSGNRTQPTSKHHGSGPASDPFSQLFGSHTPRPAPGSQPQYGPIPRVPSATPSLPPTKKSSSISSGWYVLIGLVVLVLVIRGVSESRKEKSSAPVPPPIKTSAKATPGPSTSVRSAVLVPGDCTATNGSRWDCQDGASVSFIIGSIRYLSDSCVADGYPFLQLQPEVSATGYRCLFPNYRSGQCYEVPRVMAEVRMPSVLSRSDCSDLSDSEFDRFRVIQVSDTAKPPCSGRNEQVFSYEVESTPVRTIHNCLLALT